MVDASDGRFAAVFEGRDGRFGIDKTDPSFRETEGMKAVLKVQQENRRKKRKKVAEDVEVGGEGKVGGEGAMALSTLVATMKKRKA